MGQRDRGAIERRKRRRRRRGGAHRGGGSQIDRCRRQPFKMPAWPV